MSNTEFINDRLEAMHLNAEARARALQAAFVGEIVSDAFSGIGKAVSRAVQTWRDRSERQQALAYLERLEERLLADMGLSHATLEDTLRRRARPSAVIAGPPVETVLADTATVATAANQDRDARRTAA